MKSDLVVFGEDWGRHPSSTQHLVRRLAIDRRVLWVNSIGMRRPRLDMNDLRRVAYKVARISGSRPVRTGISNTADKSSNIEVASLAAISWPGSRLAAIANAKLLGHQLRSRLRRSNMARPLLWTSLPTALPAIGQIGERSVVYYCGDDFGALAGVDHAPVLEMEDKLVEKASLIIAASEVLAGRFPRHKTLHVPHGVDMSLFSMPAPRATALHRERPTAGFYGSLSDWIDIDLLAAAAVAMPDWDFALIGPIQTDVSQLNRLANVNLIGPIDHALLPTFSQHWTASMLPFRDCEQIRACNPLKLREYLAAGRPIVTTNFPALSPYLDLVSIAQNTDQFITALRASPTEDDSRVAQRRAKVACETWDARAEVIDQALCQI